MKCRWYVSWSGKITKWSGKSQGKVREFCEGSWLDTLYLHPPENRGGNHLSLLQFQLIFVEKKHICAFNREIVSGD